jgi:hypothetical protein
VSVAKLAPHDKRSVIANVTGPMSLTDAHLHAVCASAADGSVWLRLWIGNNLIISGHDTKDPIPRGFPMAFRADLASGWGSEPYGVTLDDVAVYQLRTGDPSPTPSSECGSRAAARDVAV